jgi:MFS family permease
MSTERANADAIERKLQPDGAFAPLRHRLFAVLWCATVVGNVGSFMRDVASGWLVTEVSTSPAAVALVQAAATLPVFLLAIPAGALSDIVDRRKYLIVVQLFLAAVSAMLAVLAATASITVTNLVLLTFLGGAGAALIGPTWQSIVPELVPKGELKGAVALNSLGFNIARAIGPAVGGLLLAMAGATVTYGIDVISYLFVIAALLWWKRAPDADDALTERFGGAVRAGLRYAFASADLRRVLFRTVVFFLFANVAWALMPVVARQVLGGGASFYGVLLGATGAGAVAGAVALPSIRRTLGTDHLILAASLVMAAVLAWLSTAPPQWTGAVAALMFGAAWIAVLTSVNSTTQAILPNWVRGRGLAAYLMAFNGAMTASSLIWGGIAEAAGVRPALLAGGVCLAIVAVLLHRFKLPDTGADRAPSLHWPEPAIEDTVEHDRGPVLVTIEYKISAEQRSGFVAALTRLSGERRRDGAYAWGMSEDAAARDTILEWFFVESWAEHLRQHRRVSKADADLQAEVTRFHIGAAAPKVTHYLAIDRAAAAPAPPPSRSPGGNHA